MAMSTVKMSLTCSLHAVMSRAKMTRSSCGLCPRFTRAAQLDCGTQRVPCLSSGSHLVEVCGENYELQLNITSHLYRSDQPVLPSGIDRLTSRKCQCVH